jgi:hypothetical protein
LILSQFDGDQHRHAFFIFPENQNGYKQALKIAIPRHDKHKYRAAKPASS